MIKKIAISIGLLVLGLAISVFAEPKLRHLIQTLFRISTNNGIHFYGKDFHLFASVYYYLSFGLVLLTIWFSWNGLTPRQKVVDGLLTTMIFFIAIIIISWLNSNAMIVECTACNDGTRGIHYNEISYDVIIIGSLFLSMMPSGLRLIRRRKQPAHNKSYKTYAVL
jgi:hypothetical protein